MKSIMTSVIIKPLGQRFTGTAVKNIISQIRPDGVYFSELVVDRHLVQSLPLGYISNVSLPLIHNSINNKSIIECICFIINNE